MSGESQIPLPGFGSSSTQRSRFGERCVDLHCHVLPGIDDGPAELPDAIALARALARDGFTHVVATPHQLGRYETTNSAAPVREAVARFREQLMAYHVPLEVLAGAEVRLDERIPRLLREDLVLTIGDARKFLLLGLPSNLDPNTPAIVEFLRGGGVAPVLAHAERYEFMRTRPDAAEEWRQCGAWLQINASSLMGGWGQAAQQLAWKLIEEKHASLVATDAHSLGQRRPRMSEAFDAIAKFASKDVARRLCVENPLRVLDGMEPLALV